jgi:hypothetical protein
MKFSKLIAEILMEQTSCEDPDDCVPESKVSELPTPEEIKAEIIAQGIAHPDIVFAQARIETGNFTSNIYKENHNLFGMKVPTKRPHDLVIGKNRGHSQYANWKDSIADYKVWQNYMKTSKTKTPFSQLDQEAYLKMLTRVYCIPPDCKTPYGEEVRKRMG